MLRLWPVGRPVNTVRNNVAELQDRGYAHTLSLRLTADQYRRLRRFVAEQEDRTGKRVTHQALIEVALDEYLTRLGG